MAFTEGQCRDLGPALQSSRALFHVPTALQKREGVKQGLACAPRPPLPALLALPHQHGAGAVRTEHLCD